MTIRVTSQNGRETNGPLGVRAGTRPAPTTSGDIPQGRRDTSRLYSVHGKYGNTDIFEKSEQKPMLFAENEVPLYVIKK